MSRAPILRSWLILLLAAAALARLAAAALLPVMDPSEGRYAQIAQEMAFTGDWVTPRVWINGELVPFLGKPPLYFWAAGSAMKLLGATGFAARLPSLLASGALLVLLWRVLERHGGRGRGDRSVLVAASCAVPFALSGTALTDVLLAACVAGSLLAYFGFVSETSRDARRGWSLTVFALLALGFLAKGPVALVLFGLPVLIWTARWRQWSALKDHSWLPGGALFLSLAVPWFVLCEARNPGFLKYFLVNENLLRYTTRTYGDLYGHGHDYVRGSALWMMLAATAPWSLVALWRAGRNLGRGHTPPQPDPQASFLFLGFAAGTIFWCLARQLLITYMLPMVPLFAAWFAWTTPGTGRHCDRMTRATAWVLGWVVLATVVAVPLLQDRKSARAVVERASAFAAERGLEAPLVFARRTPYSAAFYARDWVVQHPKEPLTVSLRRLKPPSAVVLVAASQKHLGELAALPPGSVHELAVAGDWHLAQVALAGLFPDSLRGSRLDQSRADQASR